VRQMVKLCQTFHYDYMLRVDKPLLPKQYGGSSSRFFLLDSEQLLF
jgi:hypothetical protein